jgi:hypothetical protein
MSQGKLTLYFEMLGKQEKEVIKTKSEKQKAETQNSGSGSFASGSFASGSFASGSFASGSFASGSFASGSDSELPTPSVEQAAVIEAVKAGSNVVVDSVAGSGKTTTSLLLGKSLPAKRFLLITYNSRLKQETRDRVLAAGITNIEVHSYHSCGLKYYRDPCFTDLDLKNILKEDSPARKQIDADVLIFDEAQDLTPIYFRFLLKILRDNKVKKPQILVLGDHLQCIYDFPQKGADYRYLSLASQLFPSDNNWISLFLKISYRITKPIEWFVNEVMLGYPRMISVKESMEPVRYITGNPFSVVPQYFFNEIMSLLDVYEPDDIFILGPSVKSNNDMNPINKLENLLVKNGISCFCPTNDDEELKDEVLKGKVVFSSFHQSKGLERKVVIVAAFSSSYYFVGKDEPRDVCPKPIYVGATRAKERLYLWGEDGGNGKPLPFLKHHLMDNPKWLRNFRKISLNPSKKSGKPDDDSKKENRYLQRRVTDLTRFIPEEVTHMILELLQIKTIKEANEEFVIPLLVETPDGKKESVADINGTAIPAIYEHRLTGSISIQEDLDRFYLNKLQSGNSLSEMRKAWVKVIKEVPTKPKDYLLMANLYHSYMSGYLFKVVQIHEYSWLTQRMVENLLGVLNKNIKKDSKTLEFEYSLKFEEYDWGTKSILLEGRADLIDDDTLWELKCVDSIKSEHLVQLALYAWLWENVYRAENGRRSFKILNIRTGEVQEIKGIQNLDSVVDIVLDNHFRTANKKTDEEFLADAKKEKADESRTPILKAMVASTAASSAGFMFLDD